MSQPDTLVLKQAIQQMQQRGFLFLPGLTDQEIHLAENRWNFRFPPDLRAFLQIALPAPRESHHIEHKAFPNWRSTDQEDILYIQYRMNWPLDTILWDVEYNAYWMDGWGARPEDSEEARKITTHQIQNAARLIPVFAHHYLPAEPYEVGNPVFSVRGFDTIQYGVDLVNYLSQEFHLEEAPTIKKNARPIPVWGDLESK